MRILIAVALALPICGCTSPTDAERALNAEGYTGIQYTGYRWFACGHGDFYHTGFSATNARGRQVDGVVCSGLLFKGATIRY